MVWYSNQQRLHKCRETFGTSGVSLRYHTWTYGTLRTNTEIGCIAHDQGSSAHPHCGLSVKGQYKCIYHSYNGEVLAMLYLYTSGDEIFCYYGLSLLWQQEEILRSSSNPQSEHNSGKQQEILLSFDLKNYIFLGSITLVTILTCSMPTTYRISVTLSNRIISWLHSYSIVG
jgi:hypothetical protein